MPTQNAKNSEFFENRIEQPLNIESMAEWLGVKPNTLRTWVATGREPIPFFRLGNRTMFFKSSVTRWMQSKEYGERSNK